MAKVVLLATSERLVPEASMSLKVILPILALAAAATASTPAFAFKLFGGKGALIRGSVGKFVEQKVNPIATPIVRGAVETALPGGVGKGINDAVR